MTKSHRAIRTVKTKTMPSNQKCHECGKSLCPEYSYFQPDDANQAINNNSGVWCRECYEKRFNRHIKTGAEIYKDKLIKMFADMSRKTEKKFCLMEVSEMIKKIEIKHG